MWKCLIAKPLSSAKTTGDHKGSTSDGLALRCNTENFIPFISPLLSGCGQVFSAGSCLGLHLQCPTKSFPPCLNFLAIASPAISYRIWIGSEYLGWDIVTRYRESSIGRHEAVAYRLLLSSRCPLVSASVSLTPGCNVETTTTIQHRIENE